MNTQSEKDARARAEANFKKKEQQMRDGAEAMAEYLAAGQAEREKTARLRQLREAKQAADAAAAKDAADGKLKQRASAPVKETGPKRQSGGPAKKRAAARAK